MTLSALVKLPSQDGGIRYILAKPKDGNAASYAIYGGGTNTIWFYIYDGSTYYPSPNGAFTWDNTWHYVVGVYDNSKVRIYVDGAEVGTGSDAASKTISYNTEANFYFGQYGPGYGLYGTETVNEVRLSNTNRSAAWIKFEAANMDSTGEADYEIAFGAEEGSGSAPAAGSGLRINGGNIRINGGNLRIKNQ
jgi:hypothetical protein